LNDQNLLTRQGDDQAASAGSFSSGKNGSDDDTYTGSNYQAIIGDDFDIDNVPASSEPDVIEATEESKENSDAEFIGEDYQKLITQDYNQQKNAQPSKDKAEDAVFQVPVEDENMDPVLEEKIKQVEDELPHIEIVPDEDGNSESSNEESELDYIEVVPEENKTVAESGEEVEINEKLPVDSESIEIVEGVESDQQAAEVAEPEEENETVQEGVEITEPEPIIEEADTEEQPVRTSPVSFNSWISDLSEANPSSDSPDSEEENAVVQENENPVLNTSDNDNSFNTMAADYGQSTSPVTPADDNSTASVQIAPSQNDISDDAVLSHADDQDDNNKEDSLQSIENLIEQEIRQEKDNLETISGEIAKDQSNATAFPELSTALSDLTGSSSVPGLTADVNASLNSGLDSAVAALAGPGSSLDSAVSSLNQNTKVEEAPVQKAFDSSKIDFHFASVEDKKPKNFFDNIIHLGDKPPRVASNLQSDVGKDIKPLDFGNKLMPESEPPVIPAPKPSMFSSPKEANADFVKEIEAAQEKKMKAIRDGKRELPPIVKSSGPDAKVIPPQGPGDTTNEKTIDRSIVESSTPHPPVPAAAMPPVRPSIAATAEMSPNPVSSQSVSSRHFNFSADANNIILPSERVDVKKIVVKIIYGLILVVFVVVLTYLGFKFWKQTK